MSIPFLSDKIKFKSQNSKVKMGLRVLLSEPKNFRHQRDHKEHEGDTKNTRAICEYLSRLQGNIHKHLLYAD